MRFFIPNQRERSRLFRMVYRAWCRGVPPPSIPNAWAHHQGLHFFWELIRLLWAEPGWALAGLLSVLILAGARLMHLLASALSFLA